MKRIIFLTTLFFSAITASNAAACAMPIPSVLQKMKLDRLLASGIYQSSIGEFVSVDPWVSIEKISLQGPIVVSLTNGCDITFTEKYEAPSHPGMCPRFIEILADTECDS